MQLSWQVSGMAVARLCDVDMEFEYSEMILTHYDYAIKESSHDTQLNLYME